MQELYEILGINENATDEEVERAYQTLKAQYSKDRFLEGEAGNEAARNLTKLENAYSEIMESRKETSYNQNFNNFDFTEVEDLIKKGDTNGAQAKLDNYTERNAEWHYLQSVVFYKKNWINESKKQLEIAIEMDPNNSKYKDSYQKLKQKMEFSEKQFHSGNANFGENTSQNYDNTDRQMGGDECSSIASCCATWCCINLLCNSCLRC